MRSKYFFISGGWGKDGERKIFGFRTQKDLEVSAQSVFVPGTGRYPEVYKKTSKLISFVLNLSVTVTGADTGTFLICL